MKKLKSSKPCKICKGHTGARCMFCGYKAPKPLKERKEYTKQERRSDYLGSLYNGMRKYHMSSTGLIGKYQYDKDCLIISINQDEMTILVIGDEEPIIVHKDWVTDIRKNAVDVKVIEKIGDPMAPNAQHYIPHRKNKKNEV